MLGETFARFDPPDARKPWTHPPTNFRQRRISVAMPNTPNPLDDPAHVLAAIIQSSDDAIVGKDLNGIVLSWNRGAERMYGYSADEMIGQSIAVLLPEGQEDELVAIFGCLKAGQRVEPYETVRRTKAGELIDVSLRVSPITDTAGRVVGASAIARDISRQRQAELARTTSEARWRAIIDSAVDGIVVIDTRGHIESFNPAAEKMFGYAEVDVLGRNVNILMPSPYHEAHDEYLAHYIHTGEQKIIGIGREVTGLRRDGATFPVHLSVGEMRIGNDRHFTGILHDLSARTRLEGQLREQAALARLGEMAAVLAHEVKNPLAAVRGAIQVIGRRLPAESKDGPIVKEIIARIDGLNNLLQDLLLFARTPKPKMASVEIAPLLQLTADLLSKDPAFSGVGIEITGSARPVEGDMELLRIVFQNLFINAAQAMQGHGSLRIAIAGTGDRVDVRVTDTGPGIPEEARANLFRPFFTTKSRGTGLGLSTAKRLLESQNATIVVECPPGGGTVVTVSLAALAQSG
jgi:two-component system, LuxR family, sensor kinase FixL